MDKQTQKNGKSEKETDGKVSVTGIAVRVVRGVRWVVCCLIGVLGYLNCDVAGNIYLLGAACDGPDACIAETRKAKKRRHGR